MADPNAPTPSTSDAPVQPTPVSTPAPTTGAPASPDVAGIQAQMAPFQQKEQAAYGRAADIASQPTITTPPPHARLLAMVQGLSVGLSAAATSLATHGQEGGAKEVQQIRAAQQEQKLQAQAAVTAQKNAQIQQQLMIADTNHKLAQNVMLMATLPDEISKSHLEVSGEQQRQAITGADFQASHGGMTPTEFSNALAGTAPAGGQTGKASFFTVNAQQQLGSATKILGEDDPYVKNLQTTLGSPNATPKDIWTATSQLQTQLGLQEKATAAKKTKEDVESASPVGKLSTPEALASPGSQAAIQAKIDDPDTDPAYVPRLRALLPQAAVAQFNAANIKEREARNQQIVNQGSSDDAGKLLANRSLTLNELKSRQVTPAFIDAAVLAAQKYDPTFKAAESEGQSKIAGSPANQQFFGNTDSLLVKGGTLDQLSTAGTNLGNTQLPALNTVANWSKAALGSGPQAAFAAAALGVADDYSKVMTGGTGSDASRLQALNIINRDQSPEGRSAAIAQIRQAVESQRQGRVGTNPYLRDMYPDPSTTRTPAVAPSGKSVSLKAAMALPINQGKTEDQVRADIVAHGHEVSQ